MDINKTVGRNVRKYRTANKLTLQDLSAKLHKGVSTISKYEKGDIPLDMPTLIELSRILQVSPHLLLGGDEPASEPYETPGSFSAETLYMYHFGRRNQSIIQDVLEQCPSLGQPGVCRVQLFNDVKDPEHPESCSGMYGGVLTTEGYLGTYILQNQAMPREYVTIFSIRNLIHPDQRLAMVTCLSNYTMLPVSFKALISEKKLTNTASLVEILSFSRQEISSMRKTGCFSLQNFK